MRNGYALRKEKNRRPYFFFLLVLAQIFVKDFRGWSSESENTTFGLINNISEANWLNMTVEWGNEKLLYKKEPKKIKKNKNPDRE